MTIIQIMFLLVVFIAVFGGVVLAIRLLTVNPVKDRLEALHDRSQVTRKGGKWIESIVNLAAPLAKLSLPTEGWENSPVRMRFINAGWRTPSTPGLFFAGKTGLAVLLPLIVFLYLSSKAVATDSNVKMFWMVVAGGFGYYMPNFVLNHVVKTRQRDIFESFPDALDLMTVCVEAGLAMDAALARVANEIGLKSVVLAEEMQLVTLELRAGSAKDKALRNLALRTGVEDVDALVTMLIQADRFGTSIADSLRVQSEQLRTKRRQRAEEHAAKISLKLLFPLIFFIFPSLLVVLLGPAMLNLYRNLLPAMAGAN
ncbi:type II secretion system F family protein [Pseudoduganella sp. FT25W]|jgi:tight adherence protein C|uniref:Type II secretion system F family protein n=1 Tax=Duganella alba TaxID=2666081 RepID=A0A6L5QQ57_9BURK|nr:type II secretion system F family protein [Duganella alba]MRX11827.1 type II secretion system F family protein [Duganella alba]MRX19946.1 type II secretion system F family protein [Duganella alba]